MLCYVFLLLNLLALVCLPAEAAQITDLKQEILNECIEEFHLDRATAELLNQQALPALRFPSISGSEVLKVIREDLGQDAGKLFFNFDPNAPVHSTSIAQTFRARLPGKFGAFGSQEVFVKISRARPEEIVLRNQKVLELLMVLKEALADARFTRIARIIQFKVEQYQRPEMTDLDFYYQAKKPHLLDRFFRGAAPGKMPFPVLTHSAGRVLTLALTKDVKGQDEGEQTQCAKVF